MAKMTQPWSKIVDRYADRQDIPSINALRVLAARIRDSGLAEGLHAWTSMWDLCIVQSEVSYPYDGPYLKISPARNGELAFCYVDCRVSAMQWKRVVPADEAWTRLLLFLEQLHWFTVLERQSAERG